MKITLTGSIGHIGRPLTGILVKQGHQVTVVSSKADRQQEIEGLGAIPAIGSIEDVDFLTGVFTGADLVYTMIPPNPSAFSDPNYDIYARCTRQADVFATAIQRSGVRRAIHLSSIGAHTDKGNGLLRLHYILEQRLGQLANVDITFMRPTGFFYNLYAFIPLIKQQGIMAANYGGDDVTLLVAPADIADAIAEEIALPPVHRKVRYVNSEELTSNEVASILGAAIGKPGLPWIAISDEQMLQGAVAAGMQPATAKDYVEMYAGVRNGDMHADYFKHRPAPGRTRLTEFAKTFASVYNQ